MKNTLSGFNYDNDILPLGKFESIPVVSQLEPIPSNYPEVVRLNLNVDANKLREEFNNFDKSEDYFISRLKYFKNDIRQTIDLFEYLGFSRSMYQAYPLRIKGSNILKDDVGKYTSSVLNNIGVELFRQQYVVAHKGWKTKLHIDHPHFKIHGFRLFLPIDKTFISFEKNCYELLPDNAYFVNIARPHMGHTELSDRVVIMCQMASDKLVLEGTPIDPVKCDTLE